MKHQIDQSGKIENTAKHTILSISNGTQFTILLSAKDKRKLQELFRTHGLTRLFIDYTFAALVIILLKLSGEVKAVTIDIEYPGHTKIITNIIKEEIKSIFILWERIGKSARAHDRAYNVYKGKIKPNSRVLFRDIEKMVKKIAGGYLSNE